MSEPSENTKVQEGKRVRNIDPDLWRRAKAQAALEGKPVGVWINEAIQYTLVNTPNSVP